MYLIYGQFFNQSTKREDWQQIGGTATNKEDAEQFAEGFTKHYQVTTKVVGRSTQAMFLSRKDILVWPMIVADMIEG